jgi:hypothetical protein
MPMVAAICSKLDCLYVVIGIEPSGTGREQPNQAKIEAWHYIRDLLAANQFCPLTAKTDSSP